MKKQKKCLHGFWAVSTWVHRYFADRKQAEVLKDKITQERKYPEQSANFSSSLKAQKKSSVETIAKNYKNVNYQGLHKALKHALTHN